MSSSDFMETSLINQNEALNNQRNRGGSHAALRHRMSVPRMDSRQYPNMQKRRSMNLNQVPKTVKTRERKPCLSVPKF